jgi:hypothetical protein
MCGWVPKLQTIYGQMTPLGQKITDYIWSFPSWLAHSLDDTLYHFVSRSACFHGKNSQDPAERFALADMAGGCCRGMVTRFL